LLVYGADLAILSEGAAGYADKLLKGEKPSNLPVQQATAFELILNLKVAKALGLTVPAEVLIRADVVIE
jgi:putative ABC transport system substrate-binding protein